jgi:hypothetical protein
VGALHKVGRGDLTKFWIDVWFGEVSLRVCYPELYEISRDLEALVCDMVMNGEGRIRIRRCLVGELQVVTPPS